jgi:hypothetical protein
LAGLSQEAAKAVRRAHRVQENQGWDMSGKWKSSVAAAAVIALAGCTSSGGGVPAGPGEPQKTGALPVEGKGKMLAVRLPASIKSETNTHTNTPMHTAEVTGALASDRTDAGGVGISWSADKDPSPNVNQGSDIAPAVLVSAKADGSMKGGAAFIGLDKAKGQVFFENGNFGDPQVESADAAISSVSVYNHYNADGTSTQTLLKDATTIRYRDGKAGNAAANFGVGYVGNPTAAMPGSGQATYKGFYEQGIGVYAQGGVARTMFLNGDAELKADFGTGTVTGGVKGALQAYDNVSQATVNLNDNIKGMAVDTKITGTEYAGTAKLVDAAGGAVGSITNGEAIGGFFGADAAETVAATSIEGKAMLGGVESDYVLQGVIGAVKQ